MNNGIERYRQGRISQKKHHSQQATPSLLQGFAALYMVMNN
ncbi:hypothetical protein [Shewanella sp. SNU WT4]|nr:hypothetical protein [Shewanella sp. SNU WT4]